MNIMDPSGLSKPNSYELKNGHLNPKPLPILMKDINPSICKGSALPIELRAQP